MTEKFQHPPEINQATANVGEVENKNEEIDAFTNFQTIIENQATIIPEIGENTEAIGLAGKELIEDFGIQPEFFESESRSLIFTSIAKRLADITTNSSSRSSKLAEREFIADTTYLLAKNYILGLDDLKSEIEGEDSSANLSGDGVLAVYDKYTDTEFTDRMKREISNGLFDDVKKRLGINSENEEAYEIKVLSISASKNGVEGFKHPESNMENLSFDELEIARNNNVKENLIINQWEAGLIQRRSKFLDEADIKYSAPAWITIINDKKYLCLTSEMVEKILDREIVANKTLYPEDIYKRNLAILEHEYTHIQGGLAVDGNLDFGIALEERRAELFSNDKNGFDDIKNFLNDVATITGKHVNDFMKGAEAKGGTQYELFARIASEYGLNNLIELLTILPDNYNDEQSNKLNRSIQDYLGGYDGILERLLSGQLDKTNIAEVDERIIDKVEIMNDILKNGMGIEAFLANRRSIYGLNFMTDYYEKVAKEKGYIPDEVKS